MVVSKHRPETDAMNGESRGYWLQTLVIVGSLGVLTVFLNNQTNARFEARFDAIDARLDRLEDRFEDRMDGFDARLRAVEVEFGKIDQRLLTLERVLLPPAE